MEQYVEQNDEAFPERDIYVSRLNNKCLEDLRESIDIWLEKRQIGTNYELVDPNNLEDLDSEHLFEVHFDQVLEESNYKIALRSKNKEL